MRSGLSEHGAYHGYIMVNIPRNSNGISRPSFMKSDENEQPYECTTLLDRPIWHHDLKYRNGSATPDSIAFTIKLLGIIKMQHSQRTNEYVLDYHAYIYIYICM